MILRMLLPAGVLFGALPFTLSSLSAAPASTPPAFGWPVSMPSMRITAGFDMDPASSAMADWTGYKSGEPTAGSGHPYDGHDAVDIGVPTGTQVFATAAGTVNALREVVPNDDHSDTGNYLILDHSNVGGSAYRTIYWHLMQNGVQPSGVGAAVTKGAFAASSDNTGNSTGPHLHYGINLSGRNSTCPFYHSWWENDEFYYGDTRLCLVYLDVTTAGFLNCREGNSTGYSIITSFPFGGKLIGIQQNGWWRVFLPLPPATAYEARTSGGGLASFYSESGTWANDAGHTTISEPAGDANRTVLTASGSRSSTFSGTGSASDTATFSYTIPNQKGDYDVFASWPSDANALNVTYRITDAAGPHDVVVNQVPVAAGSAGTGTKADPYRIRSNPYIVNHTTVGAPDEWNSYTPTGSGIPENGPENLYRIDLTAACTVTIDVSHTGYPTKDIDLHLLTAASQSSCIARADYTITQSLAAGTYYIAADSYGSNNNAATPYTLRVTIDGPQPFANSWVKLGTYSYLPGGAGSVVVMEGSVTGRVDSAIPGKVSADAIKVVPKITRRSGWLSNTLSARINTGSTPMASVVIKPDKTATLDSDTFAETFEVPVYASAAVGTVNNTAIVAKAYTGQRFVCTAKSGDWYNVQLSNGTAATTGWILGDHLYGYHLNTVAEVQDWNLY